MAFFRAWLDGWARWIVLVRPFRSAAAPLTSSMRNWLLGLAFEPAALRLTAEIDAAYWVLPQISWHRGEERILMLCISRITDHAETG